MQILKQFKELSQLKLKNTVMTIGTFDGLHLGHQKVIKELVARAKKRKAKSLVLTYATHPSRVLHKDPKKWVPLISQLSQKVDLFKGLGVDYLLFLPFNQRFSKLSPKHFIEKTVCDSVQLSEVCIGEDTTFGKGGAGDVRLLKALSSKMGFALSVVPNVKVGSLVVRSTRIRELIQKGDVTRAAQFLGRPYSLIGKVVHGDKIGSKIGFPTANLKSLNELVPARGVYAVKVQIKKKSYLGALNIGVRPTLKQKGLKETLEVHLLGFNRAIYGAEITVYFNRKIRSEKKFDKIDQLKKQIEKDLSQVKRAFNNLN